MADGTIYLYFKNKDDILVHFFTYKTKQVFNRFRKIAKTENNAQEKLQILIRMHLEEFQRDGNLAVVYKSETPSNNPIIKEHIQKMSQLYLGIVTEIVHQGQTEGYFRKDLYMDLVKHYILGAVEEVINTWLLSGGKYDLMAMAEPLADLLIHGLGTCQSS